MPARSIRSRRETAGGATTPTDLRRRPMPVSLLHRQQPSQLIEPVRHQDDRLRFDLTALSNAEEARKINQLLAGLGVAVGGFDKVSGLVGGLANTGFGFLDAKIPGGG